MTFAAPRRFGIAAFALGLLPALAWAQAEPAAGTGRTGTGRAWTDPPAREAAGPTAGVPKPAEAATVPPSRAAVSRPVRTPPLRVAKAESARPAPRARIAARPAIARRVTAAAQRMRGHDPAFRVVTVRPAPYAAAPVIRYGYVVGAAPVRPMAYEDARAARIRQAEEAGYLVVRSRSVEFPDGRRLRTYRPLEEDVDD